MTKKEIEEKIGQFKEMSKDIKDDIKLIEP